MWGGNSPCSKATDRVTIAYKAQQRAAVAPYCPKINVNLYCSIVYIAPVINGCTPHLLRLLLYLFLVLMLLLLFVS